DCPLSGRRKGCWVCSNLLLNLAANFSGIAGPSIQQLLDRMTADEVAGEVDFARRSRTAYVAGQRAARVKATAGRRIDRARNVALQQDSLAALDRVHRRNAR